MIRLRTLAGTLRTIGARQALWWLRYRYELGSGAAAIRSPLRDWDRLRFEDGVRPGREAEAARFLEGGNSPRLFFDDARSLAPHLLRLMGPRLQALLDEVVLASTGRLRMWEDSFRSCGMPPAWNRNPLTGREQDASIHWTMIPERATGDIKGLWELSRFAIAFRLVRLYAATGEARAAELFLRLVDSWLRANPPNGGPQWISGQEVGLRAMAWTFALWGMWGAAVFGREHRSRLAVALREHGRRITASLSYARAQANNHVLSEGAALLTLGLALPWMREAESWAGMGRHMIVGAARQQIEPDGGYTQHSVNYQRLAAQLLSWSLRLGEVHGRCFPDETYARTLAMRDCLSQLVDPETGRAPNFGHNDGSLAFPLTTCEYEDFRPVVQSLSLITEGGRRYAPGAWDEEALWLLGTLPEADHRPSPPIASDSRADVRGGVVGLHLPDARGYLRCARFRSRPAHADQLHADLWHRDVNFACDAGTYLYSGEAPWENALAASGLHNTVTIDGLDQMERVGRFLWVAEDAQLERVEVESGFALAIASHRGYQRLGVLHRRAIVGLPGSAWIVVDDVLGDDAHALRLHWLTPDGGVDPPSAPAAGVLSFGFAWGELRARASIWGSAEMDWDLVREGTPLLGEGSSDTVARAVRGWRSLRYASREPALSLAVRMRTTLPARFITIWIMDPDGSAYPTSRLETGDITLAAGVVRLKAIGTADPIAAVIPMARGKAE